MKTIVSILCCLLLLLVFQTGFAQVTTKKIKVSGECGMCKKKIETAATKAGATKATWDVTSKILTVKYNSTTANTAKIEKAVAAVGYDTPLFKASDSTYNELDECCKYERTKKAAGTCCGSSKCAEAQCMKNGSCSKDSQCCKDSGCNEKECCKKS